MIISRTPLRISLFGGGTDFKEYYERYEGVTINMTIDKYIYIIIKPNVFNDRITINQFDREEVDHVDQIKHSIFREALKFTGITKGIEITSLADIPLKGTGLGSSSSLTVGLLNALFAYQGKSLTPSQLAEIASQVEIEKVGSPTGKQDQYAAAFGGLREYIFYKNSEVRVEEIMTSADACRALASHMLLFHTGIERQASVILSDQKKRMAKNTHLLHKLKSVAQDSKNYLLKLDVIKIGKLFNQGWEYKKQLSKKIQNNVINKMHRVGMQNGAYGGRVLGAGGGGFLCFISDLANQKSLKEALKGFKELLFSFEPLGSQVFKF